MPLPLIAAVLIAGGAITGSGGLALGGKGAYDLKQAGNRLKNARVGYELKCRQSEAKVATANHMLRSLGEEQKQALVDVVIRMGEFLRRHERQVRESERLLVDGIDATTAQVPGLRGLDIDAVKWIGGALGSAAAGAGAGATATAAAGSLGMASTGVAISGLSGAAAESATLALLGGGSLAAGGGGMALGAVALNFVTIGPAFLVGGLVVKGRGVKALTRTREFESKIAVAAAELDETDTRLDGITARAEELRDLLRKLSERAVAALDQLESEAFDPVAHLSRFQTAMNLVMAVRDVIGTPIIENDGQLAERSGSLTVRYRWLTEELVHG